MAKEVSKLVKLQVRGGAANPSPPVGPALGAARLAMVGALASEPVANLCPPPALVKSHTPNPAKADGLNTRYSNYKLLCEHAITVANTLA